MMMCCLLEICCDGRVEAVKKVGALLAEKFGIAHDKAEAIAGFFYDELEPLKPAVKWIAKMVRAHAA